MLLDREKFINIEYLDYTKRIFGNCFRDDIKLIEEFYSNDSGGMGAYSLTYEYCNKPYQIVFDYERLYFDLYVKYGEWRTENLGVSHLLFHGELKNKLDKADIKKAIQILKWKSDEDDLEFYKITDTGKIKKLEK